MILHYDLDAFFASVEQARNPRWSGKPLIVAGKNARGVVAAASYEARHWGVRSAMPTSLALKKKPDLIVVEPRFAAYRAVSARVKNLALMLSDVFEPISLDEAYLDLGETPAEDAVAKAREFRRAVRKELNLAVSVGISGSKLLAKLASDAAKPDGLRYIRPEAEQGYLERTPIEDVWGIGPSTQMKLKELGVETVKDLKEVQKQVLTGLLGNAAGNNLYLLSRNKDTRKVESTRERKSISHELTLTKDKAGRAEIEELIKEVARDLQMRLLGEGSGARTLTLKIRYSDFRDITRSRSLLHPVNSYENISGVLLALLGELDLSYGVRLVGASASSLRPNAQGNLFEELPNAPKQPEFSLSECSYWGMKVTHPEFGEGVLLEDDGSNLRVSFNGKERILAPDAPLQT